MNNNAMNGVANPQLPQQPGPPAQPGQQLPQPGQPGFVGPLPAVPPPPPQAAAAAANLINPGNPQQWAPLIQALLTNTNALNAAHAAQQRQNTYNFQKNPKYHAKTYWTKFTGLTEPTDWFDACHRFKACANNCGMPHTFDAILGGRHNGQTCLQHLTNNRELAACCIR